MNLSSKHRMAKPNYISLGKEEIPRISVADWKGFLELISGNYGEHQGLINSLSKLMMIIWLRADADLNIKNLVENEMFFYVSKGKLKVNNSL